jgi:hypothetical protein
VAHRSHEQLIPSTGLLVNMLEEDMPRTAAHMWPESELCLCSEWHGHTRLSFQACQSHQQLPTFLIGPVKIKQKQVWDHTQVISS